VSNPFGFTARERDAESGLMFYRARYYDPKLGRFISEDPIGFEAGDLNLYRYVFNSPVLATDPTGEIGMIEYGFIGTVAVSTGVTVGLITGNVCAGLGAGLAAAGAGVVGGFLLPLAIIAHTLESAIVAGLMTSSVGVLGWGLGELPCAGPTGPIPSDPNSGA
jgi:RHS repeat-associated protein